MQHFYLIFLLRWLILFQHVCTSSVGCGTRTLVTLLYLRALPSLPQFSLSSDWLLVRETGAGTHSDWPVALEWSVRNSSQVQVMKSECIRQHELTSVLFLISIKAYECDQSLADRVSVLLRVSTQCISFFLLMSCNIMDAYMHWHHVHFFNEKKGWFFIFSVLINSLIIWNVQISSSGMYKGCFLSAFILALFACWFVMQSEKKKEKKIDRCD